MSTVVLVAGPRSGGKTHLTKRLLAQRDDVAFAPGVVTRPHRGDEENADQHVTPEEFEAMRGDLVLTTTVGGHSYGYIASAIHDLLARGVWVVVPLMYADDVCAANDIWPDALRLLVYADEATLRSRLTDRLGGTGGVDEAVREATAVTHDLLALAWDLRIQCDDGAPDALPALLSRMGQVA